MKVQIKEILIHHKFRPTIDIWIGDSIFFHFPKYEETYYGGKLFLAGYFISIYKLKIDINWWHFKLKKI